MFQFGESKTQEHLHIYTYIQGWVSDTTSGTSSDPLTTQLASHFFLVATRKFSYMYNDLLADFTFVVLS